MIDIMSPHDVYNLVFGNSTAALSVRIDMIKNDSNWTDKIKFLNKILLQIWMEDIEYVCQKVILNLMEIAKETQTSEFLIVLKVVKELIVNKDLFCMMYSGNNFIINGVNKIIQSVKQVMTSEIVENIKRSTPSFSTYVTTFWNYFNNEDYKDLYQKAHVDKSKFENFSPLESNNDLLFPNFSLIDSATKHKNILKNKEIMIRLVRLKSRQEELNQTGYDYSNNKIAQPMLYYTESKSFLCLIYSHTQVILSLLNSFEYFLFSISNQIY